MSPATNAKTVGSLRIRSQPTADLPGGAPPRAGGGEPPAPPPGDDTIGKLLKLIPGEAMLTYTAGRGVAKEWLPMMLALALVILLALRYRGTRGADGKPQWTAICVSLGAFLIWVVTLGDPVFGWVAPWPALINVAIAAAYLAVIGIFYQGDPD